MNSPLKIGIIGDYNPNFRVHTTTDSSLSHSSKALGVSIEATWLPTPLFDTPGGIERLYDFDGLWCSAGSPYICMDGAIAAIRFAREWKWPFFAT